MLAITAAKSHAEIEVNDFQTSYLYHSAISLASSRCKPYHQSEALRCCLAVDLKTLGFRDRRRSYEDGLGKETSEYL